MNNFRIIAGNHLHKTSWTCLRDNGDEIIVLPSEEKSGCFFAIIKKDTCIWPVLEPYTGEGLMMFSDDISGCEILYDEDFGYILEKAVEAYEGCP